MQEQYLNSEIKLYCSFIDEIVKKAEWIIERSMAVNLEEPFELAGLLQLRQMTDYADGVSILINRCSNESTIPIIRAMFEVSIGFEYLLQEDYNKRATKLLYYYYKRKETELKKDKAGTTENLELLHSLKKDKNVSHETIESVRKGRNVENDLNTIKETLNNKAFQSVANYYKTANSAKRKHWYSLLDGPKDFKSLVDAVGMSSRYDVSYGYWSAKSHGWDIINRNLEFEKNGFASIIGKRNPTGSYENALEVVQILKRALMNYVPKRIKSEIDNFGKWLLDYNNRLESDFFRN